METRDILNHLGEKIGELELPEGTSEEVWQSRLSIYAAHPSTSFNTITPRQLRLQLFTLGITNQSVIDAITQAIPEPDRTIALIEWEYAIAFDRSSPFVDAVGLVLGLTPEQIDDLWMKAGSF